MSVRKHGSKWVVRWREAGRGSVNRSKTFDLREDAEFFDLSRRRAKQLGQLAHELVGSEQTLAQFVEEWWTRYAVPRLSPATLKSYAYALDRWIVPRLGQIRLRDLSREAVDELCAWMLGHGAGAPTVNRSLAILQGICRRAYEWRRIQSNPVAGIARVAHQRDASIQGRTPETIETVRARLGFQDAALVSVLAYEGLRPAEAFALEWRDVLSTEGLPRERLQIAKSLSDHRPAPTKTRRVREPVLFGPVARELAELYLLNGRPSRGSLVFPDSVGHYLRRQNWRERVWAPALEAAGLDFFRVYDLRHSCASLLIQAGWSLTEVAAHLGHSPEVCGRVYAHVFRDAAMRRGVSVDEAIKRARVRQVNVGSGA